MSGGRLAFTRWLRPGQRWTRRRWLALGCLVLAALLLLRFGLRPRDPVWARIQARGVWRVAMDPSFPPFEWVDPASQQVLGLDRAVAEALAARWGVRVEVAAVGFDELLDAVAAQRADAAISGLPVWEQRTREVAFSAPYVEAGIVIVVPRGSAIAGPADLAGRRVAAEWGSAADAEARGLQAAADAAIDLVLRESAADALAAVLTGEADAALADAITFALFAGRDQLRALTPPLASEPFVIVMPHNAPTLLAEINAGLAALEADGTLPALRAQWLKPGQ